MARMEKGLYRPSVAVLTGTYGCCLIKMHDDGNYDFNRARFGCLWGKGKECCNGTRRFCQKPTHPQMGSNGAF